ncbi:hypothetical protein R6W08_004262 [Salmonella enterica]|nr:hypothetical protein [Salmonella enterica]
MNFLPMKINQKATLLNFFCLQGLTLSRLLAYRYSAPYKTGAGFDSLINVAGSRLISDTRFFCARNTISHRIMAGRNGERLRSLVPTLPVCQPATSRHPFDSVLARLLKINVGAANMANSPQSQLVFLPYVSAVDPSDGEFHQMISGIEQKLLNRVKAALDEAGVAWIDIRTKERSKPTTTDNVEGSDNA